MVWDAGRGRDPRREALDIEAAIGDALARNTRLRRSRITVTAGPDGHFDTKLTLPEGIPDGYAELTATSNDGSFASAWVRVGTGPDLGAPLTAEQDAPLVDASLILVPVAAVLLIVAWRFWSGRGNTARARRQRS